MTGAEQAQALAAGLAACPALRRIVVVGGEPRCALSGRSVRWVAWLAAAGKPGIPPHPPGFGALLYQHDGKGEADAPVASALSQHKLVAGAASTARCLGLAAGERMLALLPFHTEHGLSALLATLSAGACALLDAPVGDAALARLLEAGEVTGLAAAPASSGWRRGVTRRRRLA